MESEKHNFTHTHWCHTALTEYNVQFTVFCLFKQIATALNSHHVTYAVWEKG